MLFEPRPENVWTRGEIQPNYAAITIPSNIPLLKFSVEGLGALRDKGSGEIDTINKEGRLGGSSRVHRS
jgi:hypothetical protein